MERALKYPRLYNLKTTVPREFLHGFFKTENKFIEYCMIHTLLPGVDTVHWSLEEEKAYLKFSEEFDRKEQEDTENQKKLLIQELLNEDQRLCIALHEIRQERLLVEKQGVKRPPPENDDQPGAKRVKLTFTLGSKKERRPFGRHCKGKKFNKKIGDYL